MGNASSKDRHEDTVDFGALHPQGIYTGPQDWNTEIVGRLIVERKLAPYYRPLEDYEEGWDDDQILAARKEPPPPPLPEPGQASGSGHQQVPPPTPVTPHLHRPSTGRSAKAAAKEPQRLTEAKAYHGAVECPICFLYYPPNINHSRCCDQPICTECFVQIKRADPTPTHLESEPASCPYCVQPNFGVLYKPPSWRTGMGSDGLPSTRPDFYKGGPTDMPGGLSQAPKPRRKSLSHLNEDVVTIDQIRPDWEEKLNQVKAAVARRANRRIIMRQVGDRLIPVGVTSGRIHPVDPNAQPGDDGTGRRRRRQQPNGDLGNLLQSMGITIPGQDLEDIMMQEAMRLSLLEHEAEEKRRHRERDREGSSGADGQSSNGAGPSTVTNTGASTPENGSTIRIPPASGRASSTPSTRSDSPRRRSNVPVASSPLAGSTAAIALGIGIPGAFPTSGNNSNTHLAPTSSNEPGSRPASHRSSPAHSRQPSGNTPFSAMAAVASSANVARSIVTPRNAPSPPPAQDAGPAPEHGTTEPEERVGDAPPSLPVVLTQSDLFEDVLTPPNQDAPSTSAPSTSELPAVVQGVTATSADLPSPGARTLIASGTATPVQRNVTTPTPPGPNPAPEVDPSSESLQPPGMGPRTTTSSSIAFTDDDASEAGAENNASALDYKVLPSTPSLQITEPLIPETSSVISATPPNQPSTSTA